jgi:serine/threonine protein kinase
VLERYRLLEQVGSSGGTTLWRALDERLARSVAVRFMPLQGELASDLRAVVARASLVSDRRAVPVLDIVEDARTKSLVVVTEWVTGTKLSDHLAARGGEPLAPREAAALALEVARFLAAAEAEGIAHAHVRPSAVMISDSGEVRVRGLGVDRVLYGVAPGTDAELADVHGAGAVLYSGLTGRWPSVEGADGLPGVQSLDKGRIPWPSRVRADVPAHLDVIAARAVQNCTPVKGRAPYVSVADVAADLTSSLTSAPAVEPRDPWRSVIRVSSVVIGTAAAVGLAALGIAMLLGLGGTPLTVPRAASVDRLPSATPTVPSTSGTESELSIVSAVDVDPYGDTKQENPDQAKLAIDADPVTAWHTVRYKNADLSGKPGVGLRLDLGAPRPVSVVVLRLVGNDTDLSLRAADDPTHPPEKFTSMAEVTGAGSEVTLRLPKPVTTRYILIWLTRLPPDGGSFQGGIADVHVRG